MIMWVSNMMKPKEKEASIHSLIKTITCANKSLQTNLRSLPQNNSAPTTAKPVSATRPPTTNCMNPAKISNQSPAYKLLKENECII